MRNKKNQLLIGGGLLAFLAFLFFCYLFFSEVNTTGASIRINIDKDDTADSVYNKINRQAMPRLMWGTKLTATLLNYKQNIHPGSYLVTKGTGALMLVRKLRGGHQDPVKLVIPVVHTLNNLASRLAENIEADSAALVQTFQRKELQTELNVTNETIACLFIPNTYEVYWTVTPEELLKRMKREHDAFWTEEKIRKAANAGLSADEAYTLASIVEQETANEAERPLIAGMYINRLRQGMKLQADPTVKFALKDFALRRIMHNHLTVDSPYNTYKHEGLPIGPICIPSLNAINAVLNYSHHDYLYMCAKEDFSGTHNFAKSYTEHLANAKKYVEALNARGIK